MQTQLADFIRDTDAGREAEINIRRCTHCGFCLATCPTYQLWGDELDSPRGRIYQMKQMLEGAEPTVSLQTHLDRCLTCRACETTCPSGVEYGRLVDISREIVEREVPRTPVGRYQRWLLRQVVPRRRLFAALFGLGQRVRPLVPGRLRAKIRPRKPAPAWPASTHERTVLMLEGCVQPALEPGINPHTARIADQLGFQVQRTPRAGCCGAVNQHLGAPAAAQAEAQRNIDAWWPHIEAGAQAIVVNASGCGAQVKDYAHVLADDDHYRERAERIADLAVDPVEFLEAHVQHLQRRDDAPRRIAFQSPCTLQHAQKLPGRVESLLTRLGFELTPVPDPHLCCGSAGTYSLLQPQAAKDLRERKLTALMSGEPELIATANIGCLTHLDEASTLPVRHWLELVTVESPVTRP